MSSHSPAEWRGGSAAGGLRDPGPPQDAAQPGNPVRLTGTLRGGSPTLQTSSGGSGEDVWTWPSGRGHHAQHPGPGLQVRGPGQFTVIPINQRVLLFKVIFTAFALKGPEQIQRGGSPPEWRFGHQRENSGEGSSCCSRNTQQPGCALRQEGQVQGGWTPLQESTGDQGEGECT